MKKIYTALLMLFVLTTCQKDYEIGAIDLDFTATAIIDFKGLTTINVGEPLELGISVTKIDKDNTYSFITNIEVENATIIFDEEILKQAIESDYSEPLKFKIIPSASGVVKVTATVFNDRAKDILYWNFTAVDLFYVLDWGFPERPLIDKKFNFQLNLKKVDTIKTSINKLDATFIVLDEKGTIFKGDNAVSNLFFGDNTLNYLGKVKGTSNIKLTLVNEWGKKIDYLKPLDIHLPRWYTNNSTKDTTKIIPYNETSSINYNIIEIDTFGINKFSGLYRLLSNSSISLKVNNAEVEQGEKFDLNLGSNVLLIKALTIGKNSVELIVKDNYNQEVKDTLNFLAEIPMKNIITSIDKVSQRTKVYQPTSINFSVEEENYEGIFSLKFAVLEGVGEFESDSISLREGTHEITYIPQTSGNHLLKIITKDEYNQEAINTYTIQASLNELAASLNLAELVLEPNEYGEVILTISQENYNFDYSLTYSSTKPSSLFVNDTILGQKLTSKIRAKTVIRVSSLEEGENHLIFEIKDIYGQNANLELKVISKAKIDIIATVEGGTATGGGTYLLNQEATVIATPINGWNFIGWYQNDIKLSSLARYSFPVQSSMMLTPKFGKNTFQISVSGTTGGTTIGDGVYFFGEMIVLKAFPETGYLFEGWYDDKQDLISSSLTYPIEVKQAQILEARFSPKNFSVLVVSTMGGTAIGSGSYKYGNKVTVSSTPEIGYQFIGWYENNNLLSLSPEYIFNLKDDVRLEARFASNKFTVLASSQVGGSATGSGIFEYGASVNIKATAQVGYEFIGWYENASLVSTVSDYTFILDNQSRNLEAKFKLAKFNVSLTATSGGTATGSGKFEYNSEAEIKALSKMGYEFIGWYENNNLISTTPNYLLIVDGNRVLEAKFKASELNLVINALNGGVATGSGMYEYGKNATITATPNVNYEFAGWYENNISVSPSLSYTFIVDKSRTLEARFNAKKFNISITNSVGGTATGGGFYEYGKDATLTAIPQRTVTNYIFEGWYENNNKISSAPTYTFIVEKARTLEAKFTPSKFNLTIIANEGGTTTGGGFYDYKTTTTITATPNANYEFAGWYENNNLVSSNTQYNLTILTPNKVLEARFIAKKFNIIVGSQSGGVVTGGGSHEFRKNITLVATAETNHQFSGWYENNILVSLSPSYTFTVDKSRTLEARFSGSKFNISVTSILGGTVLGSGLYEFNSSLTVKATTDANYEFIGWYEGNTRVSSSLNYTFTIEKARTLEAKFTPSKFEITANFTTGGTTTGGGSYQFGTSTTITATPVINYIFEGWYEGNIRVSSSLSYTFTVDKSRTLEARFSPAKLHISLEATQGGVVTGGGSYNYQTTATITATPNANYEFAGWYEGINLVSSSSSYSFIVTKSRTLEAKFSTNSFVIFATPGANGTTTGSGSYQFGTSTTLVATAEANHQFSGWYENNILVSLSPSYTFTVDKSRTLEARFIANKFNISVNATQGGAVTGSGLYEFNSSLTVKATAVANYEFEGWYENNILVSTSANYTFTIEKARTLEARFKGNNYSISVTTLGGGTVTGGGSFNYKSSVTAKAIPSINYTFSGWYENNILVSSSLSYTFTVDKSRNLEAKFSGDNFTISANSSTGGMATGSGSYTFGASTVVKATADANYTFSGWYENNILVSSSLSYTFTVDKSRTLEARFALKKYEIIANYTTGGEATGGGYYEYGKSATVVAVSTVNYTFSGWYEGNTKISSNLSYTFTVDKSRTLEARFIAKQISVSLSSQIGGFANGSGLFDYNSSVTVKATAEANYQFEGWYEESIKVSSSLNYTFTITSNRTLEARFKGYNFNITINPTEGGTTTGGGIYEYKKLVTVKATTDANYEFSGWYEGNTLVSSSLSYSFLAEKDRVLEARYKKKELKYNIILNSSGIGTVTGGGEFVTGSTVIIKATSGNNYTFTGWYEGSTLVSSNLSYTFTVDKSRTLEAKFSIEKHEVTTISTEGGTATGSGTYSHGENVTVTATAETNYEFEGWYIGTSKVSPYPLYVFSIEKNVILYAKFTSKKYTVTTISATGGSATGNGIYEHGKTITVTATATSGYKFEGWYKGSTKISSDFIYTFNVTESCTLEAKFIINKFTISTSATQGGSVTGGGEYNTNTSIALTATASTGYEFLGWYEGSTLVSSNLSYTFTVDKSRTLEAKFKIMNFLTHATNDITDGPAASWHSYIEGHELTSVWIYKDYGTLITFITPDVHKVPSILGGYSSEWKFLGWYDGNTLVSINATFAIIVKKELRLVAKYKKI